MAALAERSATYADLARVPEHRVAEIIDGELLTHRRDVVVSDLAAWRRERLDREPNAAIVETGPDWICEVLSQPTEWRDRTIKCRIYSEAGVARLWHLDPCNQILETFSLEGECWLLDGTWTVVDEVRAAPLSIIAFPLADLWPLDRPIGVDESPQAPFIGDR